MRTEAYAKRSNISDSEDGGRGLSVQEYELPPRQVREWKCLTVGREKGKSSCWSCSRLLVKRSCRQGAFS